MSICFFSLDKMFIVSLDALPYCFVSSSGNLFENHIYIFCKSLKGFKNVTSFMQAVFFCKKWT